MHVDGFRFDLASTLARALHEVDQLSSFFTIIHQDPVISRVKLIAEPWDVGEGGYQVGNFPTGWAEWNGKYRDAMRAFWRGDRRQRRRARLPAHRLERPLRARTAARRSSSINFVTAHDGFTLARSRLATTTSTTRRTARTTATAPTTTHSWNCGAEGPTDDADVNRAPRAPDAELPGHAAPLAGHADDLRRRRDRAHAARQQQRLLPGQRDQLVRLGPRRRAARRCSSSRSKLIATAARASGAAPRRSSSRAGASAAPTCATSCGSATTARDDRRGLEQPGHGEPRPVPRRARDRRRRRARATRRRRRLLPRRSTRAARTSTFTLPRSSATAKERGSSLIDTDDDNAHETHATGGETELARALAEAASRRSRRASSEHAERRERAVIATYRLQLHKGFGFERRARHRRLPRRARRRRTSTRRRTCTPSRAARTATTSSTTARSTPSSAARRATRAGRRRSRATGMGHIVDFVPNHMAASAARTAWWIDVLENGPSSLYADYFDIEWHPPKDEPRRTRCCSRARRPVRRGARETASCGSCATAARSASRYWERRFPVGRAACRTC